MNKNEIIQKILLYMGAIAFFGHVFAWLGTTISLLILGCILWVIMGVIGESAISHEHNVRIIEIENTYSAEKKEVPYTFWDIDSLYMLGPIAFIIACVDGDMKYIPRYVKKMCMLPDDLHLKLQNPFVFYRGDKKTN